jgi:hypothetical protein
MPLPRNSEHEKLQQRIPKQHHHPTSVGILLRETVADVLDSECRQETLYAVQHRDPIALAGLAE